MASKLLLAAGACFSQGGIFDKCALQPSDCDTAVFRSPHWLSLNDVTVSNQCSEQQTIRSLNSLGRCNGKADRYICTSHQTACRFAAVFEPNTDDCNLVHDFFQDNEFTNAHFGFCYNRQQEEKSFCTWSFQECGGSGSGFQWEGADTFFADSKPFCYCDDLRTGACVDSADVNVFCAVSSDVCNSDPGFTYRKVLDLESELSTQCNLCSTLTEDDLKLPARIPSTPGNEVEERGENSGQVLGITVVVISGVVGIALVAVYVIKKRAARSSTTEEEKVGGPGDGKSINSVL